MRKSFFIISFIIFSVIGVLSYYSLYALILLVPTLPLFVLGVFDLSQKRKAVRRNYPVVGNFRYWLEAIRPELQQYFVESNHNGRPINREFRSVIYQRAKGQLQTKAFGTQTDVYEENHEWVNHSMLAKKVPLDDVRVTVGGPGCKKPYSASVLNISAMSYGALSSQAIESLNLGAAKGKFYHNTGEGGISPHHLKGGDLVWQIGTAYFGCRTADGDFCENKFKEKANRPSVKMIEIKLSQGAKPGKGGMLPGEKVDDEVAEIRGVEVGKDVISPPSHKGVKTPNDLIDFIAQLRELSGGKPGFRCIFVGKHRVEKIKMAPRSEVLGLIWLRH
ncbi:MAG: FMN-binding glutamate synthase family protein [Bdellovibrionaceae bacterium]|nr:FMN-binding glutamate synthase family protein [Pseudobdellovibrionaceae bacterium]